jgi:glycerol-3-phosphate O-acyltransferase
VLKEQGARISLTLRNIPWAVEEALGVLVADKLMQRFDDPEGTIFMVEEAKRIHLDYYKNNILHFFVPFSFAANLFGMYETDTIEMTRLEEGLAFLMRIFRREFIFPAQEPVEYYRRRIQEYLAEQRGFLSAQDPGGFCQSDPLMMNYFARLLYPLFESYLAVIRTLEHWEDGAKDERSVIKDIVATSDRLLRRGEFLRWEARSVPAFRNALELCIEENLLTHVEAKGGEKRLIKSKEAPDALRLYRVYLERMLSFESTSEKATRDHRVPRKSQETLLII